MNIRQLHPEMFGCWKGKQVAQDVEGQIFFADGSNIQHVPGEDLVRGEFVGSGRLGATSIKCTFVEEWVTLGGTDFLLGITGKQRDLESFRSFTSRQSGRRAFSCGSVVEYTNRRVEFTFIGSGLLVIRHSSSESQDVLEGASLTYLGAPLRLGYDLLVSPGARMAA
ncbi:MAG TPA: hypothetical protein VFT87_03405 [Candidatus Saccharimonadales bacterium]|nr:hypothetical protein [Candidatus Saccharimonadales bacterium]